MGEYPYSVEARYAFIQRLAQRVSSCAEESTLDDLLWEAQQYFAATSVALWTREKGTRHANLLVAVPRSSPEENDLRTLTEIVTRAARSDEPQTVEKDGYTAWVRAFTLDPYRARYVVSLLTPRPLPDDALDALSIWFTLLRSCAARLHAQAYLQRIQTFHDKRLQEVTALYEIGQAMEEGNLQQLLDMITRKSVEVMDAHTCSLMLLDEDSRTLVVRSSCGLPEAIAEQARVAWGQGIAGRVAASGESMLIIDPRKHPLLKGEDVPYREDIVASLCVPLRDGRGQVMGVLNIHRRKPAPVFTEQDMRLFSVFAMQAASAIRSAQLYQDLTSRLNELSVLSQLSAAVNSTLELEQILQQTADGIVETVRFDRCAIFLLDETGKLVMPRALRGYRPETLGGRPVRIADGIIGMAVRNKELVVVEEAQQSAQPARGFARMLGTNAFLVAPIRARNRVIGVVVADNKPSGRPLDRANIQLLTTFVNQAGMAIENARLYHDLDRRYHELHNLWEYTRNLMSSIGVGVMSIDREELVLTWNDAAERITLVSRERALGYKLDDLVNLFFLPEDEKAKLMDMIRLPFRTGERHSWFKCALHSYQRGEMYFNFESSPLRATDGSVQGVVFVFENVTHEVRMEVEMQRVAQLAAVGQLASTIAHELRNPLSSIRASAQHLRGEYAHIPELCEFLDIIIAEVDVMNAKTTEFLRFARPMEPVFQEVNVAELIRSTVQLMQSYIEEQRVRVEVDVPVSIPIKADPVQLKEALRNLIINAVQATSEGGTVTLHASLAAADTVHIVVKDTGVGIPPEDLERIFTPFYTTKARGTGLGLAIVQKVVDSHGGSISVKSEVGVGTEMCIALPVQPVRRVTRVELGSGNNIRTSVPDL